MIRKLWHSPTLMTWGSYLSKGLSMVVLLPFILRRFTPAEIALWYLFLTIIGMQLLADAGFIPTFVRVIAYAMGGAKVEDLGSPAGREARGEAGPDWGTLAAIFGTMRHLYARLSLLLTLLLGTIGTIVLLRPIAAAGNGLNLWLAWGVILAVSTISLRGNIFSAYLQGSNQVALVRRWEMLTALGGILTSLVVLYFHGGLLGLICANQAWQVLDILRNAWLTRTTAGEHWRKFRHEPHHPEVYQVVWPSAWRSGVGIFMSYGLINASGLVFAQFGSPVAVASYLLGLRLFQMVTTFSTAPFYSLLPQYARLYAEGRGDELIAMAQRGMRRAHWAYVLAFVGIGVAGQPLVTAIKGHVPFPSPLLWSLMGLGFFFERYGAMHIQLYSTTNRIIWHIANGVTGSLYFVSALALSRLAGAYAFPVGIIIGYLGFYSWFTALHTYRAFHLRFLAFERRAALFPFAAVAAFVAFTVSRL